MRTRMSLVSWAVGASLAAASGIAQSFTEIEPNDTLAGAQVLLNAPGPFTVAGDRTFANPSDDFFSFVVRAPGMLSIVSSSPDAFADSIMGLYDPMGNLVASDDDGASGFMSAIHFNVPDGLLGRYTVGFSGYNPGLLACTATVLQCYDTTGDFLFDTFVPGGGPGGSTGWTYSLSMDGVALVPEPHAALLALPGLLTVLAWRRRRVAAQAR